VDWLMLKALLDTSPLVTLCVFKAANLPLIETVLLHASLTITEAVYDEVTYHYLKSDARIAGSLVRQGKIEVVPAPAAPLIRNFYRLHETDCGVIRLGLVHADMTTIIDDKEAFLVSTRYGLRPLLLLDLIVELAHNHNLAVSNAASLVQAVSSRYSPAYIAHTFDKLNEIASS
jgi:hypothetical protein